MLNFVSIVQCILSGLLIGGVYSLISIGLTLIFGVLRVINFAHGEFMMFSMYISLFLFTSFHMHPYVAVFLVVPMLFLIGILVQKVFIEPVAGAPPDIQVLITLGLSISLQNVALLIWGPDYQSIKLEGARTVIQLSDYVISLPRLIAFLAALFISGLLFLLLKKTNLGRSIRACADHREGALLIGIRVERIFMISFGIGVACVGAAGVLMMPFFYVSPHIGMTFVLTAFIVVVLGGLGKVEGAFVGGLIIGLVESLGAMLTDESLKQIITFTLFILVLFLKPSGIFGKKLRIE